MKAKELLRHFPVYNTVVLRRGAEELARGDSRSGKMEKYGDMTVGLIRVENADTIIIQLYDYREGF